MCKNAFIVIALITTLSACSSKQAYNAMASNQCQRDAQHHPAGNTADCINENKIDGLTHEEYERERNATSQNK